MKLHLLFQMLKKIKTYLLETRYYYQSHLFFILPSEIATKNMFPIFEESLKLIDVVQVWNFDDLVHFFERLFLILWEIMEKSCILSGSKALERHMGYFWRVPNTGSNNQPINAMRPRLFQSWPINVIFPASFKANLSRSIKFQERKFTISKKSKSTSAKK